jgi:hypothetical protein
MTTILHPPQIGPGTIVRPRRLPLSSQVVPSLFVGLDSFAILMSALVAHSIIVGSSDDTVVAYYAVAISFVWLTTLVLINFAGLYKFEPLMRPLTYADKIVMAFVTTFLFLLAAAFALKISETFSRIWIATFAVASCSATLTLRILASFLLTIFPPY